MARNSLPPQAGGGKAGAKGKLGKVNTKMLGLGAAAAVVVFALIKKKSAAATDSSTTSGTATYDSTATDQYNSIADQLWALQSQIGTITQGTSGVAGGGSTTSTSTGSTVTISPVQPGNTSVKATPKPAPAKYTPPRPLAKKASPGIHYSTVTVQRGNTLSGIAAKYHESLSTLLKDNPTYTQNKKYQGGNRIWAGDKVKVR